MKRIILFLLLIVVIYFFFNTGAVIPYGNNPLAGKYYNIRGFKMYCETYGEGKPLLMIHGNNGSIATFAQTIPYFSQHYQVIVADSRSQGKSIDKSDSLTFEQMADDEAELLDQMHIKSTAILGWSDGGVVALFMAIRHPEKVERFASSGANIRTDSSAVMPKVWKEQYKRYNAEKDFLRTTDEQKRDWKVFLLDWLQPNIALTELHKIHCPAFIIGGDHEDAIPVAHTTQISQNIPGAKLWIVANSGHATLIEHRDEFNKNVNMFLHTP